MAWSDKAKKGESGLVDRMWFHVSKARFAFPYENAAEACALVLDGERNIDGDITDDHIWLKVGAFEPGDKEGTFALHETQDPNRHFNKNSGMGKWLKSASDVELMDVLETRQDSSRNEYEEKDALIWEGLDLDIEYVEEEFTLRSGPEAGKKVTSRQPWIRGFKVDGQASTSAPVAGGATTNGAMTEDAARELAKGSDSFIKFLESITGQGVDPSDAMASNDFYTSARA